MKITIYTILSGIAVLAFSMLMPMFISAPPSRAAYDAHVSEYKTKLKGIDKTLQELKDGQTTIINHLIKG